MSTLPDFRSTANRIGQFYRHDILPLFRTALDDQDAILAVHEKSGKELTSDLDIAVESMHRSLLMSLFTDHEVIGEEGTGSWPPNGVTPTWVIDPVDGSHNILSGIPVYGSMCALLIGDRVEMSFIFLPVMELLTGRGFYAAAREQGAWQIIDDLWRPVAVSRTDSLADAFLIFEGPSRERVQSKMLDMLKRSSRRYRNGLSCAASGVLVATGGHMPLGCDAVVSYENKPWDNLPLALFVEEAGGRVTDINGNPWSVSNHRSLVCSNGRIHDELLALARP